MATDITADTIAVETAMERLRQEQETFDQNKAHAERWFVLRLRMGYSAAVMLPAIGAISGLIVLRPELYSTWTVNTATGVLFTDVLGLLAAVWKVVLNPSSIPKLSPVTSTKQLDNLARPSGRSGKQPTQPT